jgi:hypothetical protein
VPELFATAITVSRSLIRADDSPNPEIRPAVTAHRPTLMSITASNYVGNYVGNLTLKFRRFSISELVCEMRSPKHRRPDRREQALKRDEKDIEAAITKEY